MQELNILLSSWKKMITREVTIHNCDFTESTSIIYCANHWILTSTKFTVYPYPSSKIEWTVSSNFNIFPALMIIFVKTFQINIYSVEQNGNMEQSMQCSFHCWFLTIRELYLKDIMQSCIRVASWIRCIKNILICCESNQFLGRVVNQIHHSSCLNVSSSRIITNIIISPYIVYISVCSSYPNNSHLQNLVVSHSVSQRPPSCIILVCFLLRTTSMIKLDHMKTLGVRNLWKVKCKKGAIWVLMARNLIPLTFMSYLNFWIMNSKFAKLIK